MRRKLVLNFNNQITRNSTGGNLLKWRVNNEFINKLDIPEYRKEFMISILKQRIQDIKNHGI